MRLSPRVAVAPLAFALSAVGLAVIATNVGGCTIITNAESRNDTGVNTGTNDTGVPGTDSGTPPFDAPPGTPTSIKIKSVKASGDFKMSGRLGINTGNLTVTLASIRDPEDPIHPLTGAKIKFNVTALAGDLTCTIGQVSSTSKASVDLAFINDTTGSMSGTVNGIADSIEKFATDVAAAGVDAKFSMYTYGDAFATKAPGDPFTIGQGDFAPPSFDSTARPYVGLTDLAQFKGFLGELKASSVLGVGGGDGPENTIGALDYANKKLAWRDGAARMFVAIGDNPSHQKGSSTEIVAPFVGPSVEELLANLDGSAVIHVVANDIGDAPYVNLQELADQTGGVFLDLPSDGKVDLGALDLKSWLTSSFSGTCINPQRGAYQIIIKGTITGTKTFVGTLTFDVEVL